MVAIDSSRLRSISYFTKPGHRNKMSSAATAKNDETIELARTLAHVPLCEEYERMISGML